MMLHNNNNNNNTYTSLVVGDSLSVLPLPQIIALPGAESRSNQDSMEPAEPAVQAPRLPPSPFRKAAWTLTYNDREMEDRFRYFLCQDRLSIIVCWGVCAVIALASALPSMKQRSTSRLAIGTTGVSSVLWAVVTIGSVYLAKSADKLVRSVHVDRVILPLRHAQWLDANAQLMRRILGNARWQERLIIIAELAGLLYSSYPYPAKRIECSELNCERRIDIEAIFLFFFPVLLIVSPLRLAVLAPLLSVMVAVFFSVRFVPGSQIVYFPVFGVFLLVTVTVAALTIATTYFHEKWRREDFERLYLLRLDARTMAATKTFAKNLIGYSIPTDVAHRMRAGERVLATSTCGSVVVFALRRYRHLSVTMGAAEMVQHLQWITQNIDEAKSVFPAVMKFHAFGDYYVAACGPLAGSILQIEDEDGFYDDGVNDHESAIPPAKKEDSDDFSSVVNVQQTKTTTTTTTTNNNNNSIKRVKLQERRKLVATSMVRFVRRCATQLRTNLERTNSSNPLTSPCTSTTSTSACQRVEIVCALDSGPITCMFSSRMADYAVQGDPVDQCFRLANSIREDAAKCTLSEGVRLSGEENSLLRMDVVASQRFVEATADVPDMFGATQPSHASQRGERSVALTVYSCDAELSPSPREEHPHDNDERSNAASSSAVPSTEVCRAMWTPCIDVSREAKDMLEDDVDLSEQACTATLKKISREVQLSRTYLMHYEFQRPEMETGFIMHLQELCSRGFSEWLFVCCSVMDLALLGSCLIHRFTDGNSGGGIYCVGVAFVFDVVSAIYILFQWAETHKYVFWALFAIHTSLWYGALVLEPSGSALHDDQLLWSAVFQMLALLREPYCRIWVEVAIDFILTVPFCMFAVLIEGRTGKMKGYILAAITIMWLLGAMTRWLWNRQVREQFSARVQGLLYAGELERDYEAMEDLLLVMVPNRVAAKLMNNVRNRRRDQLRALSPEFPEEEMGMGKSVSSRTVASRDGMLTDGGLFLPRPYQLLPHVETFFTTRTLDTPIAMVRLRCSSRSSTTAVDPCSREVAERCQAETQQQCIAWDKLLNALKMHHRTILKVKYSGDTCLLIDETNSFDDKFVTLFDAVRRLEEIANELSIPCTFQAVLHSGPLMGAVIGNLALTFEYYGEASATALRVLEELHGSQIIVTERYANQCKHLWLSGERVDETLDESLTSVVDRHQKKIGAGCVVSEKRRWQLSFRPCGLYVRHVRFYGTLAATIREQKRASCADGIAPTAGQQKTIEAISGTKFV